MSFQRRSELVVAAGETGQHLVDGLRHIVVGQRQDAIDDTRRPGFAVAHDLLAWKEQPGDDPPGVGVQPLRQPRDGDAPVHPGQDRFPIRRMPCCSVEINAMVDSAPWLSLRPSRSKPS